MLPSKHFLQLLGTSSPGVIISCTSGLGLYNVPTPSGYSIAKRATMHLTEFLSAENPNVTAVAYHPGIVFTEILQGKLHNWDTFAKDTPELAGAVAVWLASEEARFMNGKYMSANWDVEEMKLRKEEIQGGALAMGLKGEFQTAVIAE